MRLPQLATVFAHSPPPKPALRHACQGTLCVPLWKLRRMHCYLAVPSSLRHPAAPFKYVRDVLGDAVLSQAQRDAFAAAALSQAPQLLALDALAASEVRKCLVKLPTGPNRHWGIRRP